MKIGWLLGWAVPQSWFEPLARAAFPGANSTFGPAAPDALEHLEEHGPFDWVGGYSLGALLLLHDPVRAGRLGRVALLAPIFAFPSEAKRGGRISRTQLLYLMRQLRHNPRGMLADFYSRAGLDVPLDTVPPLETEHLLWGLLSLLAYNVKPPLPTGWRAWCGADDALLDAAQLHAIDPSVTIVGAATHHPGALLRAFAKEAGQ